MYRFATLSAAFVVMATCIGAVGTLTFEPTAPMQFVNFTKPFAFQGGLYLAGLLTGSRALWIRDRSTKQAMVWTAMGFIFLCSGLALTATRFL